MNINFRLNQFYNLNTEKYLKYIKDNSIDLIITDPPYGINYYTNRRKNKTRLTENGIQGDHKDNLNLIKNTINELFRVLKPGRHIYWFGRFDSISKHIELFIKAGFIIKNNLIWIKNNHGTGDLYYSYAPKYECILYAIKPAKKKFRLKKFEGITRHSDILNFNKIPSKLLVHDHEKPTELLEFLIEKSSNKNEVILDPFLGSGQTMFASFNRNRQFIGFEIDKRIYKMIKNRFKHYSKKEKFIGKRFAKLLNAEYIQLNKNNIMNIDGKLIFNNQKKVNIDLQELNAKYFIEKEKLVIDILSSFYFRNIDKPKKKYTFNEFKKLRQEKKIYLKKYGKVYTMKKEDIYLIYINKKNIPQNIQEKFHKNKFYEDNQYFYFPLKIKNLRQYLYNNKNKLKVFINDKSELKDTWESGYTVINIEELKNLIIKPKINEVLKNNEKLMGSIY